MNCAYCVFLITIIFNSVEGDHIFDHSLPVLHEGSLLFYQQSANLIKQFSFYVSVKVTFRQGDAVINQKRCGGVLLDARHVLTAASCFYLDDGTQSTHVELKVLSNNPNKGQPRDTINLPEAHVIFHERFSPPRLVPQWLFQEDPRESTERYDSDLAIIYIQSRNWEGRRDLKFVTLATLQQTEEAINTDTDLSFVGYETDPKSWRDLSQTGDFIKVKLRLEYPEFCQNQMFTYGFSWRQEYRRTLLCTRLFNQAQGGFTSESDLGSPLVQSVDGRHVLYGIASHPILYDGRGGISPSFNCFFIRIEYYAKWIEQVMKQADRKSKLLEAIAKFSARGKRTTPLTTQSKRTQGRDMSRGLRERNR